MLREQLGVSTKNTTLSKPYISWNNPSGYFIRFLSKFWSGSTSHRKITQESQLVDLLEEGDSVMADRGFNIRDMLTKKKVSLNILLFSNKSINYKDFLLHPFYLCEYTKKCTVYVLSRI